MSLLLDRFLARAGDPRTAVIDAQGRHDHAELVRRARRVESALLGRIGSTTAEGLAGARIAILAPEGIDFLAAFYGILLAGGCVVVLSPLHPLPETRYFCVDAEVKTALVARALAELVPAGVLAADGVAVRLLDEVLVDETEARGAPARGKSVGEDEPALQLYTSGTTGKPKGAVLTHGNIGIQQRLVAEAWGFVDGDVLLHSLPLHHMHGLAIALLTAMGAGAAARLRTFDAAAIWDEMRDATVFMGVPAMYHRLFVAFDGADATTRARWAENAAQLRLATSGSAALPVTLAERWRVITGKIPLERFGMTEIGVGITNSLAGPRHAGLVGLPLPTVETRIVDDAMVDAAEGELLVRGPSVFAGYHRRPEETRNAFVACRDGGAPWFRTGDTVRRESELPGAPFRILGRTSVDILKSGGYKLSALEIEEVLREHPGIAEVAVIGLADDAWGERVVACIVTREGAVCDRESLRPFVRERLAAYKVPKEFLFLPELPKNALGKVVKPELKKLVLTVSAGG